LAATGQRPLLPLTDDEVPGVAMALDGEHAPVQAPTEGKADQPLLMPAPTDAVASTMSIVESPEAA
jgi:hypothetical protein